MQPRATERRGRCRATAHASGGGTAAAAEGRMSEEHDETAQGGRVAQLRLRNAFGVPPVSRLKKRVK